MTESDWAGAWVLEEEVCGVKTLCRGEVGLVGGQFVLLVQATVGFPKLFTLTCCDSDTLFLNILIVSQVEGKDGNYMYDKGGGILEPRVMQSL